MPFLDEQRWYETFEVRGNRDAPRPGIFLDRDGVIVEETHYLRDPHHVALCPGVAAILGSFRTLELPVVVVTNQSGIGQGLFGWSEFHAVHERILELLPLEQPFAAIYANAHLSTETEASWRKPNPGMLLRAAADLNIDLGASVMVGDKLVDLQAAQRAGVGRLVHVRTGHGAAERPKVASLCPHAELIDSLADFRIDLVRTP